MFSDFLTTLTAVIGNNNIGQPMADGNIHRFNVHGDRGGKNNGWYILHDNGNGLIAGSYGCWKRGVTQNWCNKNSSNLTENDRQALDKAKAINQQKLEQKQLEAKEKAKSIKNEATRQEHAYLSSKGFKQKGLVYDDSLIIPVYNPQRELCSLQFIDKHGEKRFLPGGKVKKCYHTAGKPNGKIYICEGYATGLTIHKATESGVVVAFNAGNLLPVAETIRTKYPKQEIIICADNDQWTKGNPGVTKATEAAKTINAKLVIPEFKKTNNKPTDFNDLMQQEGINEVKKSLTSQSHQVDEKQFKPSQATKLINLVNEVELFHNGQNSSYSTFVNNGHKETWLINSDHFQDWLSAMFWSKYKKAISKNSLQDALSTISGKARFEGKCHKTYMRIAKIEESIYIDLGGESWNVVKVTKEGWGIESESNIKFERTPNMEELPIPERMGKIDDLWGFINIPEQDQKLLLAFILECFRPDTPFPILVLQGFQGSAKSTTQEIIRKLIDPSRSNLRSAPKKSEDLLVAAANNWVVSFNNISHLSGKQQDELCCLSTGGGFATRELYTTHKESVVDIKRPVILNGIDGFITAQDLIDRSIIIELPTIDGSKRKTQKEIEEGFKVLYPKIFGAVLDILSFTLKEVPGIKLDNSPRMADFAVLGVALEKIMNWQKGSFLEDYQNNLNESITAAMESSPVILAVIKFMETGRHQYEDTYANLYKVLCDYKPAIGGWPHSPKGLANQIKRHVHALKLIGINVDFKGRQRDGYHIRIYRNNDFKVHQVHEVHKDNSDADFRDERSGELDEKCNYGEVQCA